jgi:hypothetical protein
MVCKGGSKAPFSSANAVGCKGKTVRGIDGSMYKSTRVTRANGTFYYRWKKVSSSVVCATVGRNTVCARVPAKTTRRKTVKKPVIQIECDSSSDDSDVIIVDEDSSSSDDDVVVVTNRRSTKAAEMVRRRRAILRKIRMARLRSRYGDDDSDSDFDLDSDDDLIVRRRILARRRRAIVL